MNVVVEFFLRNILAGPKMLCSGKITKNKQKCPVQHRLRWVQFKIFLAFIIQVLTFLQDLGFHHSYVQLFTRLTGISILIEGEIKSGSCKDKDKDRCLRCYQIFYKKSFQSIDGGMKGRGRESCFQIVVGFLSLNIVAALPGKMKQSLI